MIATEAVNIEVELGLVPRPLPKPEWMDEAASNPENDPPMLIEGVLHQGCKMVLGGTSKSNKTWALLDLALSVASGQDWWGHKTHRSRVMYVNFELPRWAFYKRINAICAARPEIRDIARQLQVWHLRGHAADLTTLRPELERNMDDTQFGLIIMDPAYKLLGDRDENANGDIASLMNEFERFAVRTGAAVVIAHHFAKGDSSVKDAMDRMAGAGAWARDPDSIMVMTPHEEENCYTVTSILRCLPQAPEFVLEWDYPLMRKVELDPEMLKSALRASKKCTDREWMENCVAGTPKSNKDILDRTEAMGLSRRTGQRYLQRGVENGAILYGSGLYWVKE